MNKADVKRVLVEAIRDSHTKEPKGADYFVDQLGTAIGPEALINTYKLAWTKLSELLIMLNKAECQLLDPGDVLRIMQYLITSSVCIKDATRPTG